MNCQKCGSEMSRGAPHGDGDAYQWECHRCGHIVPVSSSFAIEEGLGWAAGRSMLRRREEAES